MNKRFDALKRTLVSINEARQTAAGEADPQRDESRPTAETSAVPAGRTTLKMSKNGVVIDTASDPMTPTTPPAITPPPPPATAKLRPPTAPAAPPPPPPPTEPPPAPAITQEETDPVADAIDYFEPEEPPTGQSEDMAAVMREKITRYPKKPKPAKPPEDDDLILMTFKIPRYMKDALMKHCRDEEKTATAVLRNLIKQRCHL